MLFLDFHDFFSSADSVLLLWQMFCCKCHICSPFDQHESLYSVFSMLCSVKWLLTKFTFVIFLTIMNCVDVILQMYLIEKMIYLPHNSHLWWLLPSWTVSICLFKSPDLENDFPQHSQLYSLWPIWIVWTWFFKCPASENDFPQDSHLWSLWASWIVWMCFFKPCAPENDLPQDSHF